MHLLVYKKEGVFFNTPSVTPVIRAFVLFAIKRIAKFGQYDLAHFVWIAQSEK